MENPAKSLKKNTETQKLRISELLIETRAIKENLPKTLKNHYKELSEKKKALKKHDSKEKNSRQETL